MRLRIILLLLLLPASSLPIAPGNAAEDPPATPDAEAAAGPEEELQEFIPSEEIRADREVSFPVDI